MTGAFTTAGLGSGIGLTSGFCSGLGSVFDSGEALVAATSTRVSSGLLSRSEGFGKVGIGVITTSGFCD